MGGLARDARDAFREGLRHKKIDRLFSDTLVEQLTVGIGSIPETYAQRIRELCDETTGIDVDRDKVGAHQARKFAIWKLRTRHPELTEKALRTLGDHYARGQQ